MRTKISESDNQINSQFKEEDTSLQKIEKTKPKAKTEICFRPLTANELVQYAINEANSEECNNTIALGSAPQYNEFNLNKIDSSKRFHSPIWSYYNSSHQYLHNLVKKREGMRRYTMDHFDKSQNFIDKELFIAKSDNDIVVDNESNAVYYDNENENELIIDNENEIEPFNRNLYKKAISKFSKSQVNTSPYFPPNTMGLNNTSSNSTCNNPIGRCNSYTYQQNPNYFSNNPQYQQYQFQQKKSMKTYPINSLGMHSVGTPPNFNYQQSNELTNQYTIEMFGRKGWICTICNNFNYDIRSRCNRCKNDKSPKIIRSSIPNMILNPNINQGNFSLNHQTMQYDNDIANSNSNNININISNITYNNITNNNSNTIPDANAFKINDKANINNYLLETSNPLLPSLQIPVESISNRNNTLYEINQQSENEPNTISNTIPITNYNNSAFYNKKKAKPFSEQIGDWICSNCTNLNFSFRNSCNRCQLSKIDSEKEQNNNLN